MAGTNFRNQNTSCSAPAPPSTSGTHFGDGESNALKDVVTNTPTPDPVVTIKPRDSLAILQPTADLKAPTQQNRRRRHQSDYGSDNERSTKRSNPECRAPDMYWGESHQKLDAFIQQCEQNFCIDGCTQDKTRIAYAGSYCRGTTRTRWAEYEGRLEHHEPHVITWDHMKKELRRQLGEGSLYIELMHDRLHEATQRGGETVREFGANLQSIRSALLKVDEAGAPNETQLMHRMRQGLRQEIRAAIFGIPIIPKDWPTFLELAARAEFSIRQEHKSISQGRQSFQHNRNILAGRVFYKGQQRLY